MQTIKRHTPTDFVVTDTGIVIGGHHIPKPPAPSKDAETIQRALLHKHGRRGDKVISIVGVALLFVVGYLVVRT